MGDEKEVVCICIVSVYRVIEGVPEEACQTETLDIRFYVYLTKITLIRKCLKGELGKKQSQQSWPTNNFL